MQRVNECVDNALLNAVLTSKRLAGTAVKGDVNGTQKRNHYARIKIYQIKSMLAYHPNPKLTPNVAQSFLMNEKLYSSTRIFHKVYIKF